jgi:hypothetical protein
MSRYTIFAARGGRKVRCGTHIPTEKVGIATLQEFDETYNFLLAPLTHTVFSHTLRLRTHFTKKGNKI